MAVNIRGRHFLKLLDYTPAEIRYLLDLAKNFKDLKRAGTPHRYLEGKPARREKIDRAMQAARLSHLAGYALKSRGEKHGP